MDYPRVAVIVAAYNAGSTLERCIESVREQTYSNWKLYAVNDGSTDDTGLILDEYAERDDRIQVIHQENRGFFHARKAGIHAADGCDYLMFLDSDDYLCEKAIFEICINESIQTMADCVSFNYLVNGRKGFQIPDKLILNGKEKLIKNMLCRKYIDGNMPYALYRYEVVKCSYKVRDYNNDDYLNKYLIISKCNRVVILPVAGYYYYINSDSQTHKDIQEKDVMYYKHAKKFTDSIRQKYPGLSEECDYFSCWVLLWTATQLSKKKKFRKYKMYGFILKSLGENRKVYRNNRYFTKWERMEFMLVYFHLYTIIYRIFCFVNKKGHRLRLCPSKNFLRKFLLATTTHRELS